MAGAWDSDNRYIAGQNTVWGNVSAPVIYGDAIQHPSGYWQIKCRGAACQCPVYNVYSGYFYALPDAQAALQTHCDEIHFIIPPATPPAPVLTQIAPTTAAGGTASLLVNCIGSNFTLGMTINVDGLPQPTIFVNSTQLNLHWNVPPGPGTNQFVVFDPAYNQQSAALPFTRT
jgi:hypothetical protein